VATTLLILHGLVAVALIGAITHQTLTTFAPSSAKPHSFFDRFRAMPSAGFTNAIVVLYLISALLGAIVYLYFKVDIQPNLERDRHWHAMGFFDLKEDFIAIGLGVLPAYWSCWRRRPVDGESRQTRVALTLLLAFIVWWAFLVGHVINNIGGFGS
jgi:uncharacterized membrane protein YozB (DUF420 family)